MNAAKSQRAEEGIALVAVLMLLFVAGLLTAAVVAVAKLNTADATAAAELGRSTYIAEGAAARIVWLIAADRYNYSDAVIGEIDYEQYDNDRFAADGVIHTIDYYGTPVTFAIDDAVRGMNPENLQNEFAVAAEANDGDAEIQDSLDALLNRCNDYTDTDSDRAVSDGFEADDYENENRRPLPRNAPLEYREELSWVPGFSDLFPFDADGRLTAVQLLPPHGCEITLSGGVPLMNATYAQLRRAGLEESDAETALDAIASYKKDRTPLSDNLNADILDAMRNTFTQQESGVFTVRILHAAHDNHPSARLAFSFAAFPAAGPTDGILTFLEFFRY
ncbi:MAG: type II secretion system protein GspK [Victivallaceae bacterium]|nr:type II secretion system protein GspK [Victivallaceae bacterium]